MTSDKGNNFAKISLGALKLFLIEIFWLILSQILDF